MKNLALLSLSILSLAGCMSSDPYTYHKAPKTPSPTPERQIIRSAPISIDSQPAGAPIVVDGVNFGPAPVEVTFPIYADNGEWTEVHSVEAIATLPGEHNQVAYPGALNLTHNSYMMYMYNTGSGW